ncbi:MAG TPA: HAD family hydrolase [Ignavibacteriaceae bacterium]|nr:HAD family hydrolase [Ignavibacteriaceae bacterium]
MNKILTTIIFDYGGTLDTDGVHWSEKFWEAYQAFNIQVEKKEFRNAFVYSERKIVNIIKSDFKLKSTYKTQLKYQIEYLEKKGLYSKSNFELIEDMTKFCLTSVLKNIEFSKKVLSSIIKEFNLGLISNYYGNLETVLNETDLRKYFKSFIDSAVTGIRKPDKRIFELAFKALNTKPNQTIVVGDSYGNDIAPAKEFGCKTVWLEGKGWNIPIDTTSADIKIKSLKELPVILKNLK